MTTSFKLRNNEDVLSKVQLETEIFKLKGHISFIEKKFNEFRFT